MREIPLLHGEAQCFFSEKNKNRQKKLGGFRAKCPKMRVQGYIDPKPRRK